MNHIAVMLRGHMRTWHAIYPEVFAFYSSIAKNVDYYLATWENTNTDNIEQTFTGQNLIKSIIMPVKFLEGPNSWYGPSWQSFHLIPYKKIREKTVKYDTIIDTRPDVLCFNGKDLLPIQPNTYYVSKLEIQINRTTMNPDIALADWFMMCDSNTYEIMAERFRVNDFATTQISLREFAESKNIGIYVLDCVDAAITRPLIFEHKEKTFDICREHFTEWSFMSNEDKKNFCLKYNISLHDYATCSANSINHEG